MVNIGGGAYYRKHWKVLDYQSFHYRIPSYYIDYNFDLASNNPLPFKTNSVNFFYSSHTLEHIPQEFCQNIFNEFYRCLKKGGAVRLALPDFDKIFEAYRNNEKTIFNSVFFKNKQEENYRKFLDFFATYMKNKVSKNEFDENFRSMKKEEFADYYTFKIPRNNQKIHGGFHINWWNFEKAEKMLKRAGFKEKYRSSSQKSCFLEMRCKKNGKIFGFDDTYPEISFFIEALK